MILLLASVALAAPAVFPPLTADTVAGAELTLPDALPDGGVVVVAFARSQSDDLATWEDHLSGVPHAAVLVMGEPGAWLHGVIRAAMRASLPADQAAHTLLAWGPPDELRAALGEPDSASLLVLRLGPGGEVLGSTAGPWTVDAAGALSR